MNKEQLIKMLEQNQNTLKEVERLVKLAETKEDFSGVANLFQIKLGLENVIFQIENQIKQLEENGNNKQSQE